MRVIQNGFANNFGLVGKSLRRYLTTTALTATGLMALAGPALADNWTDHVADEGSISIDTSIPNTTNITQGTDFVKVHGAGDINAGWTVNVAQPSSSSKYVLYDIEGDPTEIMGTLNANGKIYIFNRDGVIFGAGSQVNVSSIIASTGTIADADIKANKLNFVNVNAGGQAGNIVLKGNISVADAGLAAFVAPGVSNSGVINAKMGNVVLASGNTVTLDMYGDNLVSVAVDGNLEKSLIENSGTIKAEGGNVVLTAAAAKEAVDNVINMDGVVDVSSVSVKGGKIILSGGSKGTVQVAGKLNASGTAAGSVKVTGQNINVTETGIVAANGTDGKISIIADNHTDFRGFGLANDGDVEVSGKGALGFSGLVQARTLLLDPTWAVIHSGALNNPLGLGYVLSAEALANSMETGTVVTVQADDFIDVGTRNTAYNTGDAFVDAILNGIIGTGNIDLSTYNYTRLEQTGSHTLGPCPFCVTIPDYGLVNHTGTTQGSVNFDSNTVNFNKDLILGNGNVSVDASTVNLNSQLKAKDGTLLGDARISSNAGLVNVKSPNATIQQGVWLANDAGGATVNVAAGNYDGHVDINKSLTLKGANAGKSGTDATRGAESTITAHSPGIHITADNVTVDGMAVTGASGVTDGYGIWVDHANNATIKNNIVDNSQLDGIKTDTSNSTEVTNNLVTNSGRVGIYSANATNYLVDGNTVSGATYAIGYPYGAISSDYGSDITVSNNTVKDATDGILLYQVGGINSITGNHIDDLGNTGIFVTYTNNVAVNGNVIGYGTDGLFGTGDDTTIGERGIVVGGGTKVTANNNNVTNTGKEGIAITDANNITVDGNTIDKTGDDSIYVKTSDNDIEINNNNINTHKGSSSHGNGIYILNAQGGKIQGNAINNTIASDIYTGDDASGVYLTNTKGVLVGGDSDLGQGNIIRNMDWDGVKVSGGVGNIVEGNDIASQTRIGVYGEGTTNLSVLNNTVYDSNLDGYGGITILGGKDHHIEDNTVSDADDSRADAGIYLTLLSGGDNTVNNNTVHHINGIGIDVKSNKNANIDINGNTVYDTDNHGISLKDSSNAITHVNNNVIGDVDGNTVIDGDGIHLSNLSNAIVQGNKIYHTLTHDHANGDDASGIYAYNVKTILVGGDGAGEGNIVRNANWDGIKIKNSQHATVTGNDVKDSTRIGIYSENSDYSQILNNTVVDSNLFKFGGITVIGGHDQLVQHNTVYNTSDAATAPVGIYMGLTTGGENYIKDNDVSNIYSDGPHNGDGIHAEGIKGNLYIVNNDVSNVEDNGIFVKTFGYALITDNTVNDVGTNGIEVQSGDLVDIDSNDVTNSGNHALYVSGPSNGDVIVSNNNFQNFDIGAEFESGLIDLTGPGNTFDNGRIGLRFAPFKFGGAAPSFANLSLVDDDAPGVDAYNPATIPTNFGGTIGAQIFTGFTGPDKFYVELANGAFFTPGTPTYLNGLNSSYDSFVPASVGGILDQSQYDYLETRFFHYVDQADLGLFWFGYVPSDISIAQEDLFNTFGAFNGDITGLNVRILGLPKVAPGGSGTAPFGANFNNIQTFAGGPGTNPNDLNNIQTAAGGPEGGQPQAQDLNNIESQAGGDNTSCWSDAASTAAGGQAVNVVYNGSMDDNLSQAASCGTSF